MKITGRLTLASILILLLAGFFSGCKKDSSSYDPSTATLNDFVGTWRGTLSAFKNNQKVNRSGDIIFYPNAAGDRLSGIMILDQVYVLEEIQLKNGVFYFNVLNSDTLNPLCINWNLSGYATHTSDQEIHAYISGNECGILGKEFVSYDGNFGLMNPEPDSTAFYSFGAQGHQWTYDIVLQSTGSCQLQQQITADNGNGMFTGDQTNGCGWAWTTKPLKWSVTPMRFSVLADTSNEILYSYYLDARPESTYIFTPGDQVNTVQMITMEAITVPAGTFKCTKFMVQISINGGLFPVQKGYYWLSNTAGIVKYQSLLSGDTTNIVTQSLASKNF
jgi:hypothetical protein